MNNPEQDSLVRELVDKEHIRSLLMRYCRAIDRKDYASLLTLYHPDAVDDHEDFKGGPQELVEYARSKCERLETMHHLLGQTHIELRGSKAFCETYLSSHSTFSGGGLWNTGDTASDDQLMLVTVTGRYLDQIERRNDEWRFFRRVFVIDFRHVRPIQRATEGSAKRSTTWPEDLVYSMGQ